MDAYLEDELDDDKVFMLAGDWSDIEKCQVFKDIVSLGGRFLESVTWSSSCTHVIAKTFVMTEKVMGAMAAGRWVVTRRFIDKSVQNGGWVKARAYVVDDVVLHHRRKWFDLTVIRSTRYGSAGFIFSGMKVVFMMGQDQSTKKEVYTRIIRAGGGEVINVGLEAVLSGNIKLGEITHVVVDPSIVEEHHPMAEKFKQWMKVVKRHEMELEGGKIMHVYYKFFAEKLQRPDAVDSEKFSIFRKKIQNEAKRLRKAPSATNVKQPEMTRVIFSPVEDYPSTTPGTSPIKCPLCLDDYARITSSGRSLMSTLCGHLFCSFCLPVCVNSSGRCATCKNMLKPNDFHPIFFI